MTTLLIEFDQCKGLILEVDDYTLNMSHDSIKILIVLQDIGPYFPWKNAHKYNKLHFFIPIMARSHGS